MSHPNGLVRREAFRLALDGVSAELAGDDATRYRVVGELWETNTTLGAGQDMIVLVETIKALADVLGDLVGADTSDVLARVTIPGSSDERGTRLQADALAAAVVWVSDQRAGKLLALEHSGWKQARVEAIRVAAAVLQVRPDLADACVQRWRRFVDEAPG